MMKGEAYYNTKELEEVVGKLRAYELNMKKKKTGYDQVQDPGICNGLPSIFFDTVNEDGDVCFVAASGGSTGAKRTSTTN
ncbi:hypothetical protein Hanom_Chr16g01428041 [Helianthus anomalus]